MILFVYYVLAFALSLFATCKLYLFYDLHYERWPFLLLALYAGFIGLTFRRYSYCIINAVIDIMMAFMVVTMMSREHPELSRPENLKVILIAVFVMSLTAGTIVWTMKRLYALFDRPKPQDQIPAYKK